MTLLKCFAGLLAGCILAPLLALVLPILVAQGCWEWDTWPWEVE
jgi:hypothetical protein